MERGGQSGKFRDAQPLAPDIGGQPGGLDGPPQRIFGQAAAEGGGEAVEEGLAPLGEGGPDHLEEEALVHQILRRGGTGR